MQPGFTGFDATPPFRPRRRTLASWPAGTREGPSQHPRRAQAPQMRSDGKGCAAGLSPLALLFATRSPVRAFKDSADRAPFKKSQNRSLDLRFRLLAREIATRRSSHWPSIIAEADPRLSMTAFRAAAFATAILSRLVCSSATCQASLSSTGSRAATASANEAATRALARRRSDGPIKPGACWDRSQPRPLCGLPGADAMRTAPGTLAALFES